MQHSCLLVFSCSLPRLAPTTAACPTPELSEDEDVTYASSSEDESSQHIIGRPSNTSQLVRLYSVYGRLKEKEGEEKSRETAVHDLFVCIVCGAVRPACLQPDAWSSLKH